MGTVSSRYCYETHVTLSKTIIMGTKLSKTENKQQVKEDVQEQTPEEKSMTLPATPETPKTKENEVEDANTTAKSEALPRSSLDRTSSFSNRLRKSMRKMVGRKKDEEEKEEDFKTVQQKARADFFKDMIPEKSTDQDEPEKVEKEEKNEKVTENDTAEETVNVSLIGSPVPEESEGTSTNEATEKEQITKHPGKEDTTQVSAVIQD